MSKSPFIWLGSGRAHRRGVSRKGQLLDAAARSGLPVPAGGVLLDEFFRICLREGLALISGNGVIIPDPIWLHEVILRDVRFPLIKKEVAIRAAVDLPHTANHQGSNYLLQVSMSDPEHLVGAIEQVWSSIYAADDTLGMDILVMEMVNLQVTGNAITRHEGQEDLVFLNDELGGNRYPLPRLGPFWKSSAETVPYNRRLQKLLSGVRRTFGRGDWRVNWADDGQICWLLKVEEMMEG